MVHQQDTLDGLELAMLEHLPPPTRRRAFPTSAAARGLYPGDDEPTVVRTRSQLEAAGFVDEEQPDLWRQVLQDPSVMIAALTAALALMLSFTAGTIGFALGVMAF